jgi:multisubunit Na+/H+ antiporter MnhC subunit
VFSPSSRGASLAPLLEGGFSLPPLADGWRSSQRGHAATLALCAVLALVLASPALAQSPWGTSTQKLQQAFTGPIAKALALVPIVVGVLASAYDLLIHFVKYVDTNDRMIVNEITSNCAWFNTGDITKAA